MATAPKDFEFKLNRKSADPIYTQLAEEIRYRIATGAIEIGTKLPPVAEGAALWNANLHTVRKAYAELAREGIAEMQRGRGTFVTALPIDTGSVMDPAAKAGLASFLNWISSHAQRTFGLDRETLAELLVVPPQGLKAEKRLSFVECSSSQSQHHASEISNAWDVRTTGWSLEWDDEPPPGPFVATYFHYNDIRRRWPHRMVDANFVSIHPAAGLQAKIETYSEASAPVRIMLYELSETMGRSIAADLEAGQSKDGIAIQAQVVDGEPKDIRIISNALYLFPPRLWWVLSQDQKDAPNVMEIEYEIAEPDMARLAHHFGWDLRLNE